jgi:NADPH:quinone reductase
MRAIIVREFGGPEKLVIEEVEKRDPAAHEVRVRISAIGLNRAEVAARVGKYPLPKSPPIRLGFEGAGVVDAVGADVTGFKVGQRVSIVPDGSSHVTEGTYAEYCNIAEEWLTPTPENLSDEESAALWMAYLTSWAALVDYVGVAHGDSVIVTAASSSLGAPTFQILAREQATSIATTRSSDKVERIRNSGADFVIDTSAGELIKRVKEITNHTGANIAYDCIGGPGVKDLAGALAYDGKILLYGMLDSRPMDLKPMSLMGKRISILSFIIFHSLADPEIRARGVRYVHEGAKSGAFKPLIARVFPFEKIAEAHEYMQSNQQVGKIVVTMRK